MPTKIETNYDDRGLELLNKHFKAAHIEAHISAIVNLLFDEAADRVLGKDFNKEKISYKKRKKIHEVALNEFRKRYGSLVNIKFRNIKKWIWESNFEYVYKTEWGRLYSCSRFYKLFFTSHCLDRWDERVDTNKYKYFSKAFYKKFHTHPTSLDILNFLISLCFQYGMKKESSQFRFLNINQGCLLIEIIGDIYIVKTFLSHDMIEKDVKWYNIDEVIESLEEIKSAGSEEIPFLKVNKEISLPFSNWYVENF